MNIKGKGQQFCFTNVKQQNKKLNHHKKFMNHQHTEIFECMGAYIRKENEVGSVVSCEDKWKLVRQKKNYEYQALGQALGLQWTGRRNMASTFRVLMIQFTVIWFLMMMVMPPICHD